MAHRHLAGPRAGGEALVRRGGGILRRLRPDLQISVELAFLTMDGLMFDAETKLSRALWEAMETVVAQGSLTTLVAFDAALDGDHGTAGALLTDMLSDDLAPIRRPDGHVPASLCMLGLVATIAYELEPYAIEPPPVRSRVVDVDGGLMHHLRR